MMSTPNAVARGMGVGWFLVQNALLGWFGVDLAKALWQ